MSFLGANDDDDAGTYHIIRAPKAPVAAPKALVAAGPPTITRYPIRLSDYRKRHSMPDILSAANTDGALELRGSGIDRHVCIVMDKPDVSILAAKAAADRTLTFTPSALAGGNGVISSTTDGNTAVPFAATVMSIMPVATAMGNQPVSANANRSNLLFAVERVAEDPINGGAGVLLTPIEYIWRTRRMLEVERAKTDGSTGGLSAAWGMAVEAMDKRDHKISGEISHYDDAIEEAPATVDAGQQYDLRVKKLRAEVDDFSQSIGLSSQNINNNNIAGKGTASQNEKRLVTIGVSSGAVSTNTETQSDPDSRRRHHRVDNSPQTSVGADTLVTIVRALVAEERIATTGSQSASFSCDAGRFVGKVLKSLPEFVTIAALRDKQKELEWVKSTKARVMLALRSLACEFIDGKAVFPPNKE